MPLSNSTNIYSVSKYIVDSSGSPYPTIQSAINAALNEGGASEIWIRQGTYNENLILYDSIDLTSAENVIVTINGTHTPPSSGSCQFTRLKFQSTTDILYSTAAGAAKLSFTRCQFDLNNGYIYNLPNWTSSGNLYLYDCTDVSTNNGIVFNTSSVSVYIYYSLVGVGTNPFTLNGNSTILYSTIGSSINLSGSGIGLFGGASIFNGNISTAGTYTLQITQASLVTGSSQALTLNSSTTTILNEVIVDSTNATAIGGTGMIQVTNIQFPNNYVIQNPLSPDGVTRTAEIWCDNITKMNFTGFYSWDSLGPYFDDTTIGTFQLLIGGNGYITGQRITWNGSQSVALTGGATNYIYIDSTGTLGVSATYSGSLFIDNIVLFECLRDSATPTNHQISVKDNQPYPFPTSSSSYLYNLVGTVISNQNNGANITANANPQSIQINGTDELLEQGLSTVIPDSGGTAITWDQMYTDSSGKWVLYQTTSTFTGQWNNGGTITNLANNRFGVYTLYVSKDNLNSTTPIYFAILNTSQYTSQATANTAIANGTTAKATNELAELGLAQLGYIIYRKSNNTIIQVTIAKSTLQQNFTPNGTNTAAFMNTSVANFSGVLSSSDTSVQTALETIDGYRGGLFPMIATNDQSLLSNYAHIVKNSTPANLTTLTLPASPIVGDTIVINGYSAGGWQIAQNATDQIFFGTQSTTFGSGGSIQSSNSTDFIQILCVTTGGPNEWSAQGSIGTLTVV